MYQTINSIPENQTNCSGNYGHLKMKTTAFFDNNCSHITINQTNGNVLPDRTYAHIERTVLKQGLEDKRQDFDNTYNVLEPMPETTTNAQVIDKLQGSSAGVNESEYNHVTAGRLKLSESKAETYSHLNRTWQIKQIHTMI